MLIITPKGIWLSPLEAERSLSYFLFPKRNQQGQLLSLSSFHKAKPFPYMVTKIPLFQRRRSRPEDKYQVHSRWLILAEFGQERD